MRPNHNSKLIIDFRHKNGVIINNIYLKPTILPEYFMRASNNQDPAALNQALLEAVREDNVEQV